MGALPIRSGGSIWADQSSISGYCPAIAYGLHPNCRFVREIVHHMAEEDALIEVLVFAPGGELAPMRTSQFLDGHHLSRTPLRVR